MEFNAQAQSSQAAKWKHRRRSKGFAHQRVRLKLAGEALKKLGAFAPLRLGVKSLLHEFGLAEVRRREQDEFRLSANPPTGKLPQIDEPMQLPIDGVLDLHTFKPREVKDLVMDYFAACHDRGILEVRIIHGKGIGNLRRTVHAVLEKHPQVISFTPDHPQFGGWGATLVKLKAPTA